MMNHSIKQLTAIYLININKLEVMRQFTYLSSIITENLSLDAEINRWIGIVPHPPD